MIENRVVRQNLGDNVVIGVQGDPAFLDLWDITVHNYNLTSGKIKWLDTHFFYFITNHKRLEDNLTICHQNILGAKGELKRLGIAVDGGWVLARQNARREINTFVDENFYVRMSVQKKKFDGEFQVELDENQFEREVS